MISKYRLPKSILAYAVGFSAQLSFVTADVSAQQMSNYDAVPRSVQSGVAPLVMLALSNDHQLYFKAYTDYDDLNGDGVLDTTEITYYNGRDYGGYFSSDHCYSYSNGVFNISSEADNHYCTGAWSGNFLNWATMTRIDMLRSVLYGGKRTGANDILERSYLPNDAHSFAKFYKGESGELSQLTPYSSSTGITICNTTLHTGAGQQTSKANTNAPLMRVVAGNYGLWASGERYQCLVKGGDDEGINDSEEEDVRGRAATDSAVSTKFSEASGGNYEPALDSPSIAIPYDEDGNPLPSLVVTDLTVRVEACPSDYASSIKNCQAYGEETVVYRPVGLLHTSGENNEVLYGLITGSYDNNKNGGYLRKNISNFSDEIDPLTGDYTDVDGIVSNIDAFRIAGWQEHDGSDWNNESVRYDNIGYNEDGSAANEATYCRWGKLGFANGHCVDWGNPLGEILAESYRYFAGLDGRVNGNAGDEDTTKAPPDVTKAQWLPLNADKTALSCANMNVIGLNTSAQSFDDEDGFVVDLQDTTKGVAAYAAGIEGAASLNAATNSLLASGDYYFIGDNSSDLLRAGINCNPKEITALSDTTGPCPDAPGLEGTWDVAGLAKIVAGREAVDVFTEGPESYNDDYDVNNYLEGNQRVITHGLQLASPLPLAKIQVPYTDNGETLLKDIVISPACENVGTFDDKALEFEYFGSCALVDFKVLSLGSQSGAFYVNWEDSEQGGDFDQDMHGIISYEVINEGGVDKLQVTTEVIGQSTEGRLGFGYTLGGVSAAADKSHFHSGVNGYPGNDSGRTTLCSAETDAIIYRAYQNERVEGTVTGCGSNQGSSSLGHEIKAENSAKILSPVLKFAAEGAGGKFVSVTDPTELKGQLESIIGDIGPTPIVGGGEATVSNSGAGSKLYLHTTYYAQKENAQGNRINWISQIGALFIDDKGRLREDTPSQAVGSIEGSLDPNDLIIQFLPRVEGEAEPRVKKYSGGTEQEGTFSFSEINYVWHTNQSFTPPNQRNIHTVIPTGLVEDTALNTDIVTGDLIEFDTAFDASATGVVNSTLLGESVPAEDLISFVKGANPRDEYRSRTLDGATYLLGDVLTSPVIQGRPDYTYARELRDLEYKAYQERYKHDAQIAYVAANDGLIHAFYAAEPTDATYAANYTGKTVGQELWAYAPFNLLPHLQWLASPRYIHVPYFDGYMRTFDVKIFGDDVEGEGEDDSNTVYPGGWGTILVVGTGRGAGAYDINLGGEAESELTTRPAYIVLDITERGQPPKLIAEISHEQLGFTTGEPDVARFKDDDGDTQWYLVFGSGPRGVTADNNRVAQQNYVVAGINGETPDLLKKPKLFAFNLKTKALTLTTVEDAADEAFIGGVNSMDWDRDFKDDALYFGTVAGGQANPTGKLFRAPLAFADAITIAPELMMDVGKPLANRPLSVIDYKNNFWVFTGSGRFYVRSDSEAEIRNNIYVGLKERKSRDTLLAGGTYSTLNLFNTTNVTINNSDAITGAADKDNNALTDIDALRSELANKDTALNGDVTETWDGWYFTFGANERQHTGTGYLASTLFFSTTVPGTAQQCAAGDSSYIYVIDMRSGVFSPYLKNGADLDAVKGKSKRNGIGAEINRPADVINLEDGGAGDPPELDLGGKAQRHSWREISIPW